MSKSKIWLSSPHMGGEELDYIHQAFKKNGLRFSINSEQLAMNRVILSFS